MEPIQTTVPVFRGRMYGKNARHMFSGANTLVLIQNWISTVGTGFKKILT